MSQFLHFALQCAHELVNPALIGRDITAHGRTAIRPPAVNPLAAASGQLVFQNDLVAWNTLVKECVPISAGRKKGALASYLRAEEREAECGSKNPEQQAHGSTEDENSRGLAIVHRCLHLRPVAERPSSPAAARRNGRELSETR